MKRPVLYLCFFLAVACHQPYVKYRSSAASAEGAAIKPVVEEIFAAYENENAGDFETRLSREFYSNDNSGTAHDRSAMERSIREDFRNLDRPYFEAVVGTATLHDGLYRIRVRWFRRAYAALSGEEWIVRDRDTVLIFRFEDDTWRLWRIEGDPIFGLSDRTAAIRLRTGTVAGAAIEANARIENGRYIP